MSVKTISHKLSVADNAESQLCDVNRARVRTIIRPVDGNVFIGGVELDHTDSGVGFRLLTGERQDVDGPSAEAAVYAYAGSGAVEVEVLEFITEP